MHRQCIGCLKRAAVLFLVPGERLRSPDPGSLAPTRSDRRSGSRSRWGTSRGARRPLTDSCTIRYAASSSTAGSGWRSPRTCSRTSVPSPETLLTRPSRSVRVGGCSRGPSSARVKSRTRRSSPNKSVLARLIRASASPGLLRLTGRPDESLPPPAGRCSPARAPPHRARRERSAAAPRQPVCAPPARGSTPISGPLLKANQGLAPGAARLLPRAAPPPPTPT